MIWDIIYIILSQFGFAFFRTLNVKYTADGKLLGAMVTGGMVNILWITTTAFGIQALTDRNWVGAIAYLLGGQIGVFYGMQVKRGR